MFTSQEQWLVNRAKHGQHRMTCPWCTPIRRNKTEECLAVLREDTAIKYQCHHCDAHGLIRLEERTPTIRLVPPVEKKQPSKLISDYDSIEDRHLEWLSDRGISSSTAPRLKEITSYPKAVLNLNGMQMVATTGKFSQT